VVTVALALHLQSQVFQLLMLVVEEAVHTMVALLALEALVVVEQLVREQAQVQITVLLVQLI
jgi:hypothetical protein